MSAIKIQQYEKKELSPYQELENSNPATNPYKFCPELIKQIQQCPGQEIGTHTFSHYYCLEAGQTQAEFQADLQAAIETAKQANIKTESLVFPRNQCNKEYLATISELGLTNYRGNLEKNLNFLQKILEHYQGLNEKYNTQSLNMGEVAKRYM